ncbi:hypothetical protein [Bradyrhizobium sp. Tv2a-2]|uniref:hypothetical protein n=1 Tax=Bradyrhizobium sp. Tv2a-2 TaxID=113395 RepID=UPI0004657125|nr:hypothetical protein [Bradyrhizobium sp. Tv2a-2]
MKTMTLEEMWTALGECWTREFGELELRVHHTLTEPTCPTAVISTEDESGPSWRSDQDTIEAAIYQVTAAAYVTLIERGAKPMTFPAPDIDEDSRVHKFLAAIDARKLAADHQ